MSNVSPMKPSAASVIEQAKAEVAKEMADASRKRLVTKYRELEAAKKVVANLQGEIGVMEKDIEMELSGG